MNNEPRILLQPNKGFSLVELLVVIAIFAVVATLAIAPFNFLKKEGALNSATESALSFLIEARTKTLSSEDESRYGVHFNNDEIVLFKGAVFCRTAISNVKILYLNSAWQGWSEGVIK